MLRVKRFSVVAVLLVLALAAQVPAVKADAPGPNYADPQVVDKLVAELEPLSGAEAEKAFNSLSPEAQKAVIAAMNDIKVEVGAPEPATTKCGAAAGPGVRASSCCTTHPFPINGYRRGRLAWTYYMSVLHCWDTSNRQTLTNAKVVERWERRYEGGWKYQDMGFWTWGGPGQIVFGAHTQARFQHCWWIFCGSAQYPMIEMRVYGNGQWEVSHSQ